MKDRVSLSHVIDFSGLTQYLETTQLPKRSDEQRQVKFQCRQLRPCQLWLLVKRNIQSFTHGVEAPALLKASSNH